MEDVQRLDPETEFLCSKQETGNEWELFKENVRPLKRGRNIHLLNNALKAQTDNQLKHSLLENRRKLIQAIDEYQGDDPLQPWIRCIKWVQEAFPPGGDYSGLVVIYEQCARTFWHEDRYKDDLRYLKVWLEYAENCVDAEVIYSFLDANKIGQSHSSYYISYALHMESKNKVKCANDIFNLGIERNAQPIEKLKAAYKKFFARCLTRPKATEDDLTEKHLPVRSFGTVLARGENQRQTAGGSDLARKKLKPDRNNAISIYKDTDTGVSMVHQPDGSNNEMKLWHSLGSRAERNKENNAIPAKWTSYKIPQRAVPRIGRPAATPRIEVFVDEEYAEMPEMGGEDGKASTSQLEQGDGVDLKRETQLLRENPLRNFPLNSLPR